MGWKIADERAHMGSLIGGRASAHILCLKPVLGRRRLDLRYSNKFKSAMIHRLSGNNPISANALSREVGVGQTTLSRWLREASVVQPETLQDKTNDFMNDVPFNMINTPKRPKDWSPEEKMQAVLDASQLSDDDLGVFLRKNGALRCLVVFKVPNPRKNQKENLLKPNAFGNWKKKLPVKIKHWRRQPRCWY